TTVPTTGGVLKIGGANGTIVNANDILQLSAPGANTFAGGQLVFVPTTNFKGTVLNAGGNTSFTFQVVDAGSTANSGQNTDQSPNSITITVASVNDAPSGVSSSKQVISSPVTQYSFTATDFAVLDPNDQPGNGLGAIIITSLVNIGAGQLQFQGADVVL